MIEAERLVSLLTYLETQTQPVPGIKGKGRKHLNTTRELVKQQYQLIHTLRIVSLMLKGEPVERAVININTGSTLRDYIDGALQTLAFDEEPVAYLRDAQPEAEDEALVVCIDGDPGSFPVYRKVV